MGEPFRELSFIYFTNMHKYLHTIRIYGQVYMYVCVAQFFILIFKKGTKQKSVAIFFYRFQLIVDVDENF